MTETNPKRPTFEYGSDEPVDLLSNAINVMGFLTGVIGLQEAPPLEEDNAHGLFLILTGVEETLKKAKAGMEKRG